MNFDNGANWRYNKDAVRPRSSVDRAPASGAGCGGSIPLGGAIFLLPLQALFRL